MTDASLRAVAHLLEKVGSPTAFAARRTADAEDLDLNVKGVGKVRFPISPTLARKLRRVSRPAPYGQRERTLLDRGVRDTWQVPKSRVKIDKRRWNRTLLPILEALRADLGLPETCRLKAQLHAMLLYGPGQFFAPHQDSEKTDDMIGTLVVMLPASFKGGSLVIEHQGEQVTYRGSKKRLTFVAFYSDCRHEVRPVRAGFRIVLSYNLMLTGRPEAREVSSGDFEPEIVEALSRRLREHFETPLPSQRSALGEEPTLREPPNRLVYLLDHQYTQRGLAWSRLKGADIARAAALRAAAQRADCELVLALAEVHETWSCFEPGWNDSWHRRHRYWERDEDDDWIEKDPTVEDPDTFELDELVDCEITLGYWIDASGKKTEEIVTDVSGAEVCSTTPSSALEPHASEYEGYMGNYGNTMDRWYRRAAVVIWPRERAFTVRAEVSPGWAVDELRTSLQRGRRAEACEMMSMLWPFWETVVSREESPLYFDEALRVAAALDAPALAVAFLRPFRLEQVAPRGAAAFVGLAERYGDAWTRQLLSHWSGSDSRYRWLPRSDELPWIAALPRLCRALDAAQEVGGKRAACLLLRNRWTFLLDQEIPRVMRLQPPSLRERSVEALAEPLLGILAGSELTGANDLTKEVCSFFIGQDDDALLSCLVEVLRSAQKAEDEAPSPPLDVLRDHVVERLQVRLGRPERAENDWSIALPAGCRCELCTSLEAFLAQADRKVLEWPLNKQRRQHIHRRIDSHELPVRHQTRRSGRPYTLVLEKTSRLFEAEARRRRSWRADLLWLSRSKTP